jgi:hypothetical protein
MVWDQRRNYILIDLLRHIAQKKPNHQQKLYRRKGGYLSFIDSEPVSYGAASGGTEETMVGDNPQKKGETHQVGNFIASPFPQGKKSEG